MKLGVYSRWGSQAVRRRVKPALLAVALLMCALTVKPGDASANNLPVVVAGERHSCALSSLSGGTVSCWGDNSVGQLGDGTNTNRSVPTEVPGLSGVSALAAGGDHTCAVIASTGAVKCWGSNSYGQLGNNTTINSSSPVDALDSSLAPLVGIADITGGFEHTCARSTSGGVVCWGRNLMGQLGDGTAVDKSSASPALGFGSNVTQVSAGLAHTCLVTTLKEVWCFGQNTFGALGNNSTTSSSTGVRAYGIFSATEVSAGPHFSCARLENGAALCWGLNNYGNFGDGSTTPSLVPVSVSNLTNISMIEVGGDKDDSTKVTCATESADGQAKCWGNGIFGALGNGEESQYSVPVNVTGLTGAVALATGANHSCAWVNTCDIRCWGYNAQGQLGTGDTTNRTTPVQIRTCDPPTPPPTPTATPTPTPPSPGQGTPDACRPQGETCIPDSSLVNPLSPQAPPISVQKSTRKVTLVAGSVRLGLPTDERQREKLKSLLGRLLGGKVSDLYKAVKTLKVVYVFTIVASRQVAAAELTTLAAPKKIRLETRKRRVTARLGPGSYVATVSVKITTSKGKVVARSSPRSQSFSVPR